jgi:MYXO-CTERM domain-containing protein
MPLRAGYAVNAFAAVSGRNFFSLEKNEASTVTATMTEETETHGSIVPAKGSEICEGDFGAPVCSSTGGKIYGYNLYGTCGLSGLVVSRADAPASPASPDEPASPAASKPNTNPAKCSGGAWKVAELGRYRDFLAKLAPSAFAPLRIDKPIIREFSYVPEGLWGYQTDGGVAACALDGAKLNAVKPGALSAKLSAKVSFSGMDRRAAAWGRFGIAPKSEPTRMRWLPAQRLDTSTAVSFDSQFEGAVSSDLVGEYIVAFRASANGGETWTTCDTDGIENGYSADKTLSLSVAVAPAAPPSGSAPPTDNTAPSGDRAASDPPPVQGETVSDGEGDAGAAPSTKKKSAGGCAVSTTPSALASAPPIVGVLLGLAAVARRRRRV